MQSRAKNTLLRLGIHSGRQTPTAILRRTAAQKSWMLQDAFAYLRRLLTASLLSGSSISSKPDKFANFRSKFALSGVYIVNNQELSFHIFSLMLPKKDYKFYIIQILGMVNATLLAVHEYGQTAVWILLLNACLIATRFPSRLLLYIHAVTGTLIFLASLSFMVIFFVPKGFHVAPEKDGLLVYVHGIAGVVSVSLIGLQGLVGLTTKLLRARKQTPAATLSLLIKMHRIGGYGLALVGKLNVLVIWSKEQSLQALWICLIIEQIIFIGIYCYYRVGGAKMSPFTDTGHSLKRYSCCSEISEEHYVIFKDRVYSTVGFQQKHPGGANILQYLNKREVDRFLYGVHASEHNTAVKPHSHSSRSITLLGASIGTINYLDPYTGFQGDRPTSVVISRVELLSQATSLYMIYLTPLAFIHFNGFQSSGQFGRYFALTRANTTRLYCNVSCFRKKNMEIMRTIFIDLPVYCNKLKRAAASKDSLKETLIDDDDDDDTTTSRSRYDQIPIAMKIYPKGKFTSALLNSAFNPKDLQISSLRGKGLDLQSCPKGQIFLVAGGTGILPFCDFIDSLWKRKMIEQNRDGGKFKQTDGYLYQKASLNQLQIILMGSFQQPEDIPALTCRQLGELRSLKIILRISQREEHLKEWLPCGRNVHYTKEYFAEAIIALIKRESLSRIYICGPPNLSSSMIVALKREGYSEGQHFVLM